MPQVEAVCMNSERGKKYPCSRLHLIENLGVDGDVHAASDSLRQVSILCLEDIEKIRAQLEAGGIEVVPGMFGENIIVSGFSSGIVKQGGRLVIGENAEIEVTVIGKDCPAPCDIYHAIGTCIMPEVGIFGKVVKGGNVEPHDSCDYR